MGNHTPGPWRASGTRVVTLDGRFIAECGPHDLNNASGDAAFISRAPSLLNALRIAIGDSCGGCGRETCVPCQTIASVEVGS